MAIFRKLHTSFWSDSFVEELDKDQKLFYLYLLTNERTNQCGVYEITKKQISYDLGYSIDRVSILLDYFISKGRIRYNEQTKELAIAKWLKYNNSTSPKVQSCINKGFTLVKDTLLIDYVKSMHTLSQEEEEQEEEKEQEEEEDLFADFIESFNMILGKNFKKTDGVRKSFNARIKDGYTQTQMLESLENAKTQKYHIETDFKYLTPS